MSWIDGFNTRASIVARQRAIEKRQKRIEEKLDTFNKYEHDKKLARMREEGRG